MTATTADLPLAVAFSHHPDRAAYLIEIGRGWIQGHLQYRPTAASDTTVTARTTPIIGERGPDGARLSRDERQARAFADATQEWASLEAVPRRVRVQRVQVIEVEVDAAYTDVEAEWIAFRHAEQITDEQWANGVVGYRSGFYNQQLPSLPGGTPIV